MLLAVTSATWIVTGLGFGIVLALLFCLVYILQSFGWIMQKATAPKAPKPEKPSPESKPTQENTISAPTKPAPAPKADDDTAAIAYALYLAQHLTHDHPTAMIHLHPHASAWHTISIEMNNVGF